MELERAKIALEGLSVGDAFGEQFLHMGPGPRARAISDRIPSARALWKWTDDTAMARAIVEVLAAHGGIEIEPLARAFAADHDRDAARGYGSAAHTVLDAIWAGLPWYAAARIVFDGEGSRGNGGGMRSAPIGAYFGGDLDAVVEHAARSAGPTHAHPDGVAGAIAIAVAAAVVVAGERDPRAILEIVVARTPAEPTRENLRRAIAMFGAEPVAVAAALGNGSRVLASDTVPFAVWCAATHVTDYAAALWACCEVGGDLDTTCAMVGGIVAGAVGIAGIPAEWRAAREPLFASDRQ